MNKLRDELSVDKRKHDFDFLMNNQLLDAFANEVLRYIPIVVAMPKVIIKDGVEMNGCPIHKGETILMQNYITSKNEQVWGENAEGFDPQRFIDNAPSKQVWYPFGLGSKICIGWKLAYLEIKIVTSMLLNYQIELDQGRLEKITTSPFNFYDINGRLKAPQTKAL